MPQPIDFEFKLVSTDNLTRFSEMAEACLGLKTSDEYFRWKYLDNPAGEVVAFEALHAGRPAAFYGVIPELYLVNKQIAKVYQSMDTMTHPDYQKRGLFTKLANMTYNYLVEKEGGVNLVGIPGSNSLYGFVNKLQWKKIQEFRYFFAHKTWFQARSLLHKKRDLTLVRAAQMSPALRQYFDQREPSSSAITNLLSADFFNWRVFQNPYKGFNVVTFEDNKSIVGVAAYALDEKKRGLIHLLDFRKQSFFAEYTASAIALLFRETGSQYLYTWEPLNKKIHQAYSNCGFIKNPIDGGPFSYRVPFIVRAQGESLSGVDWFDIRNFDLQPLMQD